MSGLGLGYLEKKSFLWGFCFIVKKFGFGLPGSGAAGLQVVSGQVKIFKNLFFKS